MLISYANHPLRQEHFNAHPRTAAGPGTLYGVTLTNKSSKPWTFYIYQKPPESSPDVFSLAWFCSPYKVQLNNRISFQWGTDYSFVWGETGILRPGITFDAGGATSADPETGNTSVFAAPFPHDPEFSAPVRERPYEALTIKDCGTVPDHKYAVGIGMSGKGAFVTQSSSNLIHNFTPRPSYWIAASNNVQLGSVLRLETITQNEHIEFGPNVYNLSYTLNAKNQWEITRN